MDKKRFKKGINLSCVDTKTGKTYWYACNLCGLLNELYEDNRQLKKLLQEAEEEINKLKKSNTLLMESIVEKE